MPERYQPRPGTKTRYPLYDKGGVMLLASGATMTSRLAEILKRRGIHVELQAKLEVVEGGALGTLIKIPSEALTIGRAPACKIRPNDPCVSLHHCRIKRFAGAVVLQDLQSTNGTFVNGERIVQPVELWDQDQIQVGRFVFAIHIYADVAAESDADRLALDAFVLDEESEEPTTDRTLFARDRVAAGALTSLEELGQGEAGPSSPPSRVK